jgi:hypothetical protein
MEMAQRLVNGVLLTEESLIVDALPEAAPLLLEFQTRPDEGRGQKFVPIYVSAPELVDMVPLAVILAAAQGNEGFRAVNVIAVSRILLGMEAEGLSVTPRQLLGHATDLREGGNLFEVLDKKTKGGGEIISSHGGKGEGLSAWGIGGDEKGLASHGPAEPVVVSPHEQVGERELRGNGWMGTENGSDPLSVL